MDDDEAQPDLPSCLAQLSSTSFPLLNTLTIAVETTPRLQLVERILSFGRVTRLCLNVDLPNADDLDRLEVALREAAGRLKTFGTITPQFRPSFIRNLYPLLGVCDTLEIELQFGETIPLPTSLQILSLRNLTIFGATQEYLVELESFVLSRKTPLDVLEIDVDGLEYQRLEEACERVGTRLVKSCIEAVLSPCTSSLVQTIAMILADDSLYRVMLIRVAEGILVVENLAGVGRTKFKRGVIGRRWLELELGGWRWTGDGLVAFLRAYRLELNSV